MKNYEITVILAENEPDDKIKKIIAENAQKVSHQEDFGLKGLAYPIKKQTIGHFIVFNFETNPENISKIEKDLKINDKVLRYLIIRDLREPSTKAAVVLAPPIIQRPKVETKPFIPEEKIKPPVAEEIKEPAPVEKVKEPKVKVEEKIIKSVETKPPRPAKPKPKKPEDKNKSDEISQEDLEKKLKELVMDE